MGRKSRQIARGRQKTQETKEVDSLLDKMEDGNEYGSIVSFVPRSGNVIPDIRKALAEVEKIRERPAVCYLANVIKPLPNTSIDLSDDLPFNELVSSIDDQQTDLDILLATGGGSGQQVSQFVNCLRPRFEIVNFILPHACMSAGTLWALSGDDIWMDKRAYIGPIDPQVRSKDGNLVPAQSILVLLNKIKQDGEEALKKGNNPPWHYIRLVDTMDQRQIGDAISLSEYSIKMATSFLNQYKFKNWTKHSSTNNTVTEEEKYSRAKWIADKLCSNEYWKSHAHGITRDVAISEELKLKIHEIESVPGLQRAIRRFWALIYYTFDKSMIVKMFLSQKYSLIRSANQI